jgi:hypothetical protein
MADPEIPERIFDDPSIQKGIAEVRRIFGKPDVFYRSFLIKISAPMDEFVSLLAALIYDAGLNAAANRSPTPSERLSAVTVDLDVLIRELENIEGSRDIGTGFAAKIAEERKRLISALSRLERAAAPGLRRRKQASKPQ